jgi:hypothetical protein
MAAKNQYCFNQKCLCSNCKNYCPMCKFKHKDEPENCRTTTCDHYEKLSFQEYISIEEYQDSPVGERLYNTIEGRNVNENVRIG